jgi:hypothetical protein
VLAGVEYGACPRGEVLGVAQEDECVVDDARLERRAHQQEHRDEGQQERPSSKAAAAPASLDMSSSGIEHDAETLSAKAAGV